MRLINHRDATYQLLAARGSSLLEEVVAGREGGWRKDKRSERGGRERKDLAIAGEINPGEKLIMCLLRKSSSSELVPPPAFVLDN